MMMMMKVVVMIRRMTRILLFFPLQHKVADMVRIIRRYRSSQLGKPLFVLSCLNSKTSIRR